MPDENGLDQPRSALDGAPQRLYESVAARLGRHIAANGWEPGRRLPGERVLAEEFGVSRVTLRAALNHLQRLGMIEASASRGWFVAGNTPARSPHISVPGFADFAASTGLRASARVLSQEVRPATFDEAGRLMMAPGADLFELRRLRYLDDQIVALELNQLPLAVCPALMTTDFSHASLYATLRAATPPAVPCAADYSVGARTPTPEEAQLLEIADSSPVLEARQIAHHADRPIEYSVAVYRADRYRFRASQHRPPWTFL